MKRIFLIMCLLSVIIVSISGCGSEKNIKSRPSDEELTNASTVCGVVREVNEDTIKVQLCGNIFEGIMGHCYIDVKNEYDMTEGDSVLLYYTGKIDFEEKDTCIEANDIDECYMESYDNDGKFVAKKSIPGGLIPDGTVQVKSISVLTPLDDEPEQQFYAVLSINNYVNGQLDPDNPGGWTDIVYEVEDEWGDVIVTYDIDTMEVISITQ